MLRILKFGGTSGSWSLKILQFSPKYLKIKKLLTWLFCPILKLIYMTMYCEKDFSKFLLYQNLKFWKHLTIAKIGHQNGSTWPNYQNYVRSHWEVISHQNIESFNRILSQNDTWPNFLKNGRHYRNIGQIKNRLRHMKDNALDTV